MDVYSFEPSIYEVGTGPLTRRVSYRLRSRGADVAGAGGGDRLERSRTSFLVQFREPGKVRTPAGHRTLGLETPQVTDRDEEMVFVWLSFFSKGN